jgi:transcriptional regulator with XRE-family HTH domain
MKNELAFQSIVLGKLRGQLNISMEKVALELGWSTHKWFKKEHGQSPLTIAEVFRIEKIFKVRLYEQLKEKFNEPKETVVRI